MSERTFDPEAFGREMGMVVREMLAPLQQEIASLKEQLAQRQDVTAEIAAQVKAAVDAIPTPKDGKDADMAEVLRFVKEAVEAIPKPKDGKSVTLDDVRPVIAEAVKVAVKEIPSPEPAKVPTADDLLPVIREAVQKAVSELPQPTHVVGAMIDREGSLLLTMSNGDIKSLGRVVGKDGADGLSFESFDLSYIEETHEISIKATCAGVTKELRYDAGGIRPGEYWRDGVQAKAGQVWACDGSSWIAKRATKSRPSAKSEDWILAARKGRDGESVVREVKSGPAEPVKLTGGK